jgi:hypothetical protein
MGEHRLYISMIYSVDLTHSAASFSSTFLLQSALILINFLWRLTCGVVVDRKLIKHANIKLLILHKIFRSNILSLNLNKGIRSNNFDINN